jgi:hypothetical protein
MQLALLEQRAQQLQLKLALQQPAQRIQEAVKQTKLLWWLKRRL